ncbi:MAG: SDR family NAD(P)-dependent oxidoreductase [Elusimicrobiota bacterium]|jgi:NAD(P)-dependent dehydrogenase (short-subunit alcohol dehydrogenase family)
MKTVLITGASRGLGRELALAFAHAGYAVAVNYQKEKARAETVVQAIQKSGGTSEAFPCDVRNSQAVGEMIDAVLSRWGHLDVLINNAGLSRNRTLLKMSDEEWSDVIDTNLNGVFRCLRAAARVMAREENGSIINIASYLAFRPSVGAANYAASKAAVVALTRAAAVELGRFSIRVNAVCPGFHETAMGDVLPEEVRKRIQAEHVLGHSTRLDDLTRMVLELAANESISGQIINVDSRLP